MSIKLPSENFIGNKITSYEDYFVPASPELGNLLSGQTDCYTDDTTPTPQQKLIKSAISFVVTLIIFIVGTYLYQTVSNTEISILWKIVIPLVPALLVAWMAHRETGFNKFVCYIGEDGVQWSKATGTKDKINTQIFLFKNATDLKTELRHEYVSGAMNTVKYSETSYSFNWYEIAGEIKRIYLVSGKHRAEFEKPDPRDENGARFHFLTRAEEAWNQYIYQIKLKELEKNGFVDFDIGDGFSTKAGFVRLSPDFVEIRKSALVNDPQNNQRVDKDNFKQAFLINKKALLGSSAGEMVIQVIGKDYQSKLIGSNGQKLEFKFNQISNKDLFFRFWSALFEIQFQSVNS